MLPKFEQLIDPVLKLLATKNYKIATATDELVKKFKISEDEKDIKLKSGQTHMYNRVAWAFFYLKKAEFIEHSEERATYKITALGRSSLEEASKNGQIIDKKYLKNNSVSFLKNWQIAEEKDVEDSQITEKENVVLNEDNESVRDLEAEIEKLLDVHNEETDIELIQKIRDLSWQNFEDFCARLLEKMGYGVAQKRVIRQRDGGIDGEIFEDELGLKGKIYLQAKKYQSGSKVGVKDIKEFLYNIKNEKGVFITTSDFSDDARSEVAAFKDAPIALINYKELIRLCKKYEHACRKKTIEIFKLD